MGILRRGRLAQILIEFAGTGVAIACIIWVLWHLVVFLNGYVLVGESNKLILLGEVAVVSFGLLCFLINLCRNNSHTNRSKSR